MLFKSSLVGVLSALAVTRVASQSCVQLNETTLVATSPCTDAFLTFTLEGVTTVAENTVNLAIIVDGSGSINEDEFLQEQSFTEEIVASFAALNLFTNGGNASYVQFASDLVSFGTFGSLEDFNEFVDNDIQARGGTNTASGIDQGTALLGVSNTSAAFMIVITDGGSNTGADPILSADKARAEGITVLAVGVGNGVNDAELLGIAGNESNVFSVSNFDALDAALLDVVASSGGSTINCPSTGVNLTIEFNVTVVAADPGVINRDTVTFNVDDLEAMPTDFAIILDLCDAEEGDAVVLSVNYTDDQGNDPDLSDLTDLVVGVVVTTAPPTPMVTPSPTMVGDTPAPASPTAVVPPSAVPTPAPAAMVTLAPSPIMPVDPTPPPSPSSTADMPSMSPTSAPTMFSLPIP